MNSGMYAIFTMSPAMVRLTNMMFVMSWIFWGLAAKLIYAAWLCRDTDPASRLIATQRKRHAFLAAGVAVTIACGMYLLHVANWSLSNIEEGIHYTMLAGDPVRFAVVGSMYALPLSLLVAVIVLGAIYANPADLAYRLPRGTYRMTGHVRGYPGFPAQVTLAVRRGDCGLERIYLPGDRREDVYKMGPIYTPPVYEEDLVYS